MKLLKSSDNEKTSILLKDYSESIKDDVMIGLKSVTLKDGTVIDAENVKSIQMNHMDKLIEIQ